MGVLDEIKAILSPAGAWIWAELGNIERLQKCACKIFPKEGYTAYASALVRLNIQSLSERRKVLAKRFAEKCPKS